MSKVTLFYDSNKFSRIFLYNSSIFSSFAWLLTNTVVLWKSYFTIAGNIKCSR